MNCPRCKIPLKKETLEDVRISFEVDRCDTCEGIWFDEKELSKVDKIIEPVFWEIKNVPNKKDQLKALSCPSCGDTQILDKAQHPRDKKVIIDYCSTCKGIWLDKGELEAIQKENGFVTIGKFFAWMLGVN